MVIPYQLLYYVCNFQNYPGQGWFDFWPGCYLFHSANQSTILKKLRETIEWGDQVYKDDVTYPELHFYWVRYNSRQGLTAVP